MLKALTNKESKVHRMVKDIFAEAIEWYKNLDAQGDDWASHATWDLMKLTLRDELKEIDDAYRKRRSLKLKKAREILNMDDLKVSCALAKDEIIQAKKGAMEEIRVDQQRTIQNIKASSDFNWIRDGEHSNKLFFMQTKVRIKQNRIPDLRLPNGNLTTNSRDKKNVASDSYAETFSKRLPDPSAMQKTIDALIQANKRLSNEMSERIKNFTDLESLDPRVDQTIEQRWHFITFSDTMLICWPYLNKCLRILLKEEACQTA